MQRDFPNWLLIVAGALVAAALVYVPGITTDGVSSAHRDRKVAALLLVTVFLMIPVAVIGFVVTFCISGSGTRVSALSTRSRCSWC